MKHILRQLILAFALGAAVYGGQPSEGPSTALRTPALAGLAPACSAVLAPQIDGPWWQVAGNPMDHKYSTEKQEPVDFAVWQAADGSWQLWSCIRNTTAGGKDGKTRFFYGWEGKNLTDADWKPKGIAMEPDPSVGETPGGLQAPHVVKVGDTAETRIPAHLTLPAGTAPEAGVQAVYKLLQEKKVIVDYQI